MNSLVAQKCCCIPLDVNCNDPEVWAAAPDTVTIVSSQTWVGKWCRLGTHTAGAICCSQSTNLPGYDPPGCPAGGAGFAANFTTEYSSTQTVVRTAIGTLHKHIDNLGYGRYVGNDPSRVAASDQSVPVQWEVDVVGGGTRPRGVSTEFVFTRVSDGLQYRFCTVCREAESGSFQHSDSGTIYPRIELGCIQSYLDPQCGTVVPSPPFGRVIMNERGGGFPDRVVYVNGSGSSTSGVPAGAMPWPPILSGCPNAELVGAVSGDFYGNPAPNAGCGDSSYQVCPGCGDVIPGSGSCWSCRSSCVPSIGGKWVSPIGYGTEWLSIGSDLIGQYAMAKYDDTDQIVSVIPGCSICPPEGTSFECPSDPNESGWCYSVSSDQQYQYWSKLSATGSLSISG